LLCWNRGWRRWSATEPLYPNHSGAVGICGEVRGGGFTLGHSTRYKLPRLSEFPILLEQALKFVLHSHIMSLMKFPRQCIRSHSEKFANTVSDPRESCAKHLLLSLFSYFDMRLRSAFEIIAKLWD
jgi:hypothetical protein